MKEKYIFFTLLVITLVILAGSGMGKGTQGKLSSEELALELKLKRAEQRKLILPEKINMDRIQNLVAFSYYEGMLKRSPFFKVQPKRAKQAKRENELLPVPVEEMTPVFIYKGKIVSGSRLVVIIEQTRSGEVFMVSKDGSLDGYKVLDITDSEVILSKKGEENIILKTIERP